MDRANRGARAAKLTRMPRRRLDPTIKQLTEIRDQAGPEGKALGDALLKALRESRRTRRKTEK